MTDWLRDAIAEVMDKQDSGWRQLVRELKRNGATKDRVMKLLDKHRKTAPTSVGCMQAVVEQEYS